MRVISFIAFLIAPAFVFADDSAAAADDAAAGKIIYSQTCVACHGANGKGTIPGVRDFTAANGPLSKPDDVLIDSITNGFQTPGSAMAMPPKGGNPVLNVEDIKSVILYLRAEFGS